MSEQRAPGPPGGGDANEILWVLLRDLSVLSRAQARLMGDLAKMIEHMHRGATAAGPIEDTGAEVAQPTASATVSHVRPPVPGADVAASTEPETPSATSVEPAVQPLPPDHAKPVEEVAPPPETSTPPPRPADEPVTAVPAVAESVPDEPLSPDERAVLLEEEEGVEGNGKRLPAMETAIPIEAEADREASAEGPDDLDESVNADAPVLILESEDARVGVLWDHVIQIGSIGSPVIPESVATERGDVELVSLGLLLHGVSKEEKYFVVLEQDGERAAVACERMLGVGPLGAAIQQERGARIQVLKVPMLRTFAASVVPNGANGGSLEDQKAADERDRHGPLRALVAVRYLPARVAICRHLRGRGWQVGEAAGLEAATVSLDLGRWDLLFLEAHGNGESEATEGMLLRRVTERDVPVIRVGSRISGFPGREGPALMFPFSESELDAILTEKRGNRSH
jgi:hypothetical protein